MQCERFDYLRVPAQEHGRVRFESFTGFDQAQPRVLSTRTDTKVKPVKANAFTRRYYDVEMRRLNRLFRLFVQISTLTLCLSFAPANAETKEPLQAAATAEAKPAARQALDEEEAAELARRSEEPGAEVAGGALSNEHLTYIVIALATAVIILLAK